MHFIVKFFPEITVKSAPVRKRFIKILRDNLRQQVKAIDAPISVQQDWDKIDVSSVSEDEAVIGQVVEVLSHTPGIAHFSKVQAFELGDQHSIYEHTQRMWGEALTGKTFCVRVKRQGEHDFTSTDIERYVGGGLNQHNNTAGVKLKNPDITIKIEIKHDRLYVVERQRPGLGGFPLGTQEPVLSLVSGGFDSTVASYLTIKRGIRTHFCFFNLGGRAHEVAVKEVAYYLWSKFGSTHRVKFVTVPFEGVVDEILKSIDNSHMGVVLKRMMLRAATQVARAMEIDAIVTGEAVAQVSSQTLTNLSVIDEVTDILTLRPLITMDKGDIVNLSRDIGTEDFSANIPEYCGVISRKPTTRAKLERVKAEEERFDFTVLENAVEERVMESIDKVVDGLEEEVRAELVGQLPANGVVIDIRHPDEEELDPLALPENEVLKLPFYQLNNRVGQLDKDRSYYLYCKKGVMSQLHASHLIDAGYQNIGVYRPDN